MVGFMKQRKKISNIAFEFLIMLLWTQTIIVQYFRAAIMRLPLIGAYPDAVIALLYIIVVLLAIPNIKLNKKDFLVVTFIVVFYFFQRLYVTDIIQIDLINEYWVVFILRAVPYYCVGSAFSKYKNKKALSDSLYYLSIATVLLYYIYSAFFGTRMTQVQSVYEGDMALAYNLLVHYCVIACHALRKPKFYNIILTVLGLINLFVLGTRGAILIYIAAIAVILIKGNSSKGIIARIAVIFGGAILFVSTSIYEKFIIWLYNRAQQLGLSVRVMQKLLDNEAFSSSGRDSIRKTLLDAISEKPVWGYGVLGDRRLANIYAHNIAIELWTQYGIVLGSIFLIAVILVLFFGYKNETEDSVKFIIFAIICASFFKLMLSGSYLDEPMLFFVLGFCAENMTRAIKKRGLKRG